MRARKSKPASVSVTARVVRTNSATPISRSSVAIVRDAVDCGMFLCGRVIPASAAVLRAQSERSRRAAPASDAPHVAADLAPPTSGGDPELKPAIAQSTWARPWLRRLRAEVAAYWSALVDRRVPWYARISGHACIFVYSVIPIDPIPDRLPIVGHLDDVIMVVLALALSVRLIPAGIKERHRVLHKTV